MVSQVLLTSIPKNRVGTYDHGKIVGQAQEIKWVLTNGWGKEKENNYSNKCFSILIHTREEASSQINKGREMGRKKKPHLLVKDNHRLDTTHMLKSGLLKIQR